MYYGSSCETLQCKIEVTLSVIHLSVCHALLLFVPHVFFEYLVSSTGQDQSSYARPSCLFVGLQDPVVCLSDCKTQLSVCPIARPSCLFVHRTVHNSCYCISFEAFYHKGFFVMPVSLPYGVVVQLPKGYVAILAI